MRNVHKYVTAITLGLLLILPLYASQAAGVYKPACDPGENSGFGGSLRRVACDAGLITSATGVEATTEETIIQIIGGAISIIFGFVGVVFAALTVYGGYLWMTARGNEDQVQQSQNYIRNSIIGIIIVLAAFSITQFIITRLIAIISQNNVSL